MVYVDDFCPVCKTEELYLNTSDLMECPKCNLMISTADPVVCSLIPKRGLGKFRFEDSPISKPNGSIIAKSRGGTNLPDLDQIFKTEAELINYVDKEIPKIEPRSSNDNHSLWFDFKNEFDKALKKIDAEELNRLAESKKGRTKLYKEEIMPMIAKALGLVHGNEEFKVDYVMSVDSFNGFSVPKIYIESENDFNSAEHEVRKLCSLNSPLRVLLTAHERKDLNKIFNNLRIWQSIVKGHKKHNREGFGGTIGVIIGVFDKNPIAFYSCSFWDNGDLRQPFGKMMKLKI